MEKNGRYFYCPECGDYLNEQSTFSSTMDKWTCKSCGCVSDLAHESFCANELAKKYEGVLGKAKKEYGESGSTAIHWQCSRCQRVANDIDEINVIFGFVRTNDGKLKPQKICKMCRSK